MSIGKRERGGGRRRGEKGEGGGRGLVWSFPLPSSLPSILLWNGEREGRRRRGDKSDLFSFLPPFLPSFFV
jgi:hypothetical protein